MKLIIIAVIIISLLISYYFYEKIYMQEMTIKILINYQKSLLEQLSKKDQELKDKQKIGMKS